MTKKRHVSVLILGASYGTGNMGVDALLSGTISAALHTFPHAEITLLDYNRVPVIFSFQSAQGAAEIRLANLRFSKNVFRQNHIARLLILALLLRLMPFKNIRRRVIQSDAHLNTIAGSDVIVSLAGGDSFSDIYGLGRLLYVSLPQILVLLLGKSLVLLPQTLGPFKSASAKAIASYIMNRAQIVFARDRESPVEVRPLVRTDFSRFRFSYDMGFALEPLAPPEERLEQLRKLGRSRPLVGLNISGLLFMGGYSRRNMFALNSDYRDLIRSIIKCFTSRGVHLLLVPHVVGTGSGPESDATAAAAIHHELRKECGGRLHLLEGDYNHHEIKFVIAQCDFFLGSRMHACIAALSQCVPAIGLAYSRKFRGVFQSVGVEHLVVDLTRGGNDEITERVASCFDHRDSIRAMLEKRMPAVRAGVFETFSGLGHASDDLQIAQTGERSVIEATE